MSLNRELNIYGISFMTATSIVLLKTIYGNHTLGYNKTLVHINTINEANIELILVSFLSLCLMYVIYNTINKKILLNIKNKVELFIVTVGYTWGVLTAIYIDIMVFRAYISPTKTVMLYFSETMYYVVLVFSLFGVYSLYWCFREYNNVDFKKYKTYFNKKNKCIN